MNHRNAITLLAGFSLLLFAASCHKKTAALPPPVPAAKPEVNPAPPPPKPLISLFVADPTSITKGQSSTLRWVVNHATDITVTPGIGEVSAQGSHSVSPETATTYTLTAKGPGGSAESTVSVSVTVPPARAAQISKPAETLSERLSADVHDAYFDFDQSDIRADARTALKNDAVALRAIFIDFPNATVRVEGHCDERGSAEYNLALGDRRAQAAKDFLVEFGVPASKLSPISYGKERPQCTEHNEHCWQLNRRAHFAIGS